MKKKALIFGAYGNFGKLISKALLKSNIPVIVAGRKLENLQKQEVELKRDFPSHLIESCVKDID